MSRFHVHLAVDDLDRNIAFYSAVFGVEPSVVKPDYAKWDLSDPKVNFAISTRGSTPGLDHVGIQADNDEDLSAIRARLEAAGVQGLAQQGTTCCYAQSDKYWVVDPQGIAWETFHTLGSAPVFGENPDETQAQASGACCTPNLSGCCG